MASRLIPSLLLVFLPACLFPQTPDKPVVSVLDFEASGLSQAEAQVFVDFIASHIVKTGAYRVIDRKQREALLEEIEFSYADCAEETSQIEIGRLLAASHIVVGSVGKVAEWHLITTKLIEVQSGESVRSISDRYPRWRA